MSMTDEDIVDFLKSKEGPGRVCIVCDNPETDKLLKRILDAMIKTSYRKTKKNELREILYEQTSIEITRHQLDRHLSNCIRDKWKEAKHGQKVRSGRMAKGTRGRGS